MIQVHLVPGHKDIKENELADKHAIEGAKEMLGVDIKLQLIKRGHKRVKEEFKDQVA